MIARDSKFFSIIMPVFNRAHLVQQAVQSVLDQECQDFELILVDDGSSDGTRQALEQYRERALVVHQDNRGPGAARNAGVELAQGRYVVFIDSDDFWFPWTLAAYREAIQQSGEPAIVAGRLWYFWDDQPGPLPQRESLALQRFDDYLEAGVQGVYCGAGQACFRRDCLLRVGALLEQNVNAEDHDLLLRAGVAPGFVRITAPAMIAYRQHSAAATQDLDKSFIGSLHLIRQERSGEYPGGPARKWARRRILTSHVRPVSIGLLKAGRPSLAWQLFRQTLLWNLPLLRLRYVLGFMALAVAHGMLRRASYPGSSNV